MEVIKTQDSERPASSGAVHTVPLYGLVRWSLLGCVAAELLLVACDLYFEFFRQTEHRSLRRLFNMAREDSIPTWFASAQAFSIGLTLLAVVYLQTLRGARRRVRFGFLFTALFFFFVSMDDAATFHEKVGSVLGDVFANPEEHPFFIRWLARLDNYGWQMFVMPVFALAGVAMFAFVARRLHAHGLLRWFVLGLAAYVVAIGLDFVEGIEDAGGERGVVFRDLGERLAMPEHKVSHLSKLVEEYLEMLGTSLIWYGFLRYLTVLADGIQLRFTRRREA